MIASIDIKDISGRILFTTLPDKGCKRKFTLMKEDYITLKFPLEEPIYFKLGDYVECDFGRFEVCDIQKPSFNTNTAGYDYELRLDAHYWKWKNKIFKYTPESAGQEASWNQTAPLDVHAGIVLRNLKALGYTFNGRDFDFSIDSSVENKSLLMSYDNINILDSCFSMAKKWGCECWVTENIIHFGRCENGTPVDFEIGKNVEEMPRSDSQSTYATRIYAFGSTRNIPSNYRPVDETIVVNGVVQKRLMLPVGTPYIDAYPNMRTEEAIEQVIVLDNVYPRRTGTISNLTTHEYTDTVKEEGKPDVVTKWNAYRFKDTGIKFSKDYVLPGEELKITFHSGKLNGMEFAVTFNPCDKEGGETPVPEKNKDGSWNPDAQVWEIVRNEDYGRKLPGDVLIPANGDTYILSGWDSTKITELGLVSTAEQELKTETEKYVAKSKIDPSTYNCKMMSDDAYSEDGVHNLYSAGQKVNLINKAYFENGRQSRVIGFEFNLDCPFDSPVYTVGETAAYSRIAELEEKVDNVTLKGQTYTGRGGSGVYLITSNDTTPATDSNVFSARRALRMFLRKDQEDETKYLTKFLGGLVSGEIAKMLKGLLIGENGSGITVLENGMSQAVVDYLYVKVKAIFDELDVKKKTYVGGEQVISHAGMKCIKVEEMDDAYRCYFKAEEDGIEIENQFTVGSLAIAQECNIKTGVSHHAGNRYYWRAVTAVGTDYIDLSKTVCDQHVENDIPVAGDDIVGLGHLTDITRQGAIILSSVNEVSPSILMYQGINDFTLSGKETIGLDFDKSTGRARLRVYGDAYIGAKDRSSYIEYGKDGLEVRAKRILLGSGDTLDSRLDEINMSLQDVNDQLDRSFQIWQGETADAPTLTNAPASGWKTENDRLEHLEDFYITTEGLCYQFVYEGGTYRWRIVTDKYLITYVQQIGEKKRVFPRQPTDAVAYDEGDCWVNASFTDASGKKLYDNDRLVCITAKAAGAPFSIAHWQKDSKYTDDARAEELNKETADKLLKTGIDIEKNTITATSDKFTIRGRDGKEYAVFELDANTGLPVAKMTGSLIAKIIMAGGLNIDDKFVVTIRNGKAEVSVKGDFDAGDGTTHLDKDGTGWIGKISDEYFAKWNDTGDGSLCFGNIVWNAVKKLLSINGQITAKGGSKIGNLTINENGALLGGNAVFEDFGYSGPMAGSGNLEDIADRVRKSIINRIGQSTTMFLGVSVGSENETYTVDLPTTDELRNQGIFSNFGFRMTLIVGGEYFSKTAGVGSIFYLNPTFRISSRPRRYSAFYKEELPDGEIHDNNDNRVDYIDLSKGDVLELYYYGGIYYLINKRT